jgi:hypothetical protein
MNGGYTIVFEVSYFSNGFLLWNIGFLAVGIAVVTQAIGSRMPGSRQQKAPIFAVCLWSAFWFFASGAWLYSNLTHGHRYTDALANNQCEVVEGTVQVLHEQPAGGHAAGDRIRIGDKEFTYSYFHAVLSYNRTISHGGQLKNGVAARLHYLDNAILKVEIKNAVPSPAGTVR